MEPSVVGSIPSQTSRTITEAPAWTEPCRILILSDAEGRRHARIEWVDSEVNDAFFRALLVLCSIAMKDSKGEPLTVAL